MNIYLVRHGQSEGNLKKFHQGADVPLSKNGKVQAKILAQRFKKIPVDSIYSSPYIRAKQTAEFISKELKLPIEYWDILRERKRPSEIEGLSLDDPKAIKINSKVSENLFIPDYKYSDDESFNDLVGRAEKVKRHLLIHHKNQNVVCVSHAGFTKLLVLSIILGNMLTPEVFWQFFAHTSTENTGITHLEYTEKYGWRLETWNDVSHI